MTGRLTPAGGEARDECASIGVGQEQIVEEGRARGVADDAHHVAEPRHDVEPYQVARDVVEVVGRQDLEITARRLHLPHGQPERGYRRPP